MRIPSTVLRRAEVRHGLVTFSELDQAGVSRRSLQRLVAGGQLAAVYAPSVYRLNGSPRTWRQKQLAACLATGGISSHRAAAELWGIDLGLNVPVEVSAARARRCQLPGVFMHRPRDFDLSGAATRDSIPVSTPLRMLVDLGAVAETHAVARALEKCVIRKLVSVKAVRAELDRVAKRGRSGVSKLRRVLDDWPVDDVRPDSVLELRFARLCRRFQLPTPVFQFELTIGGRRRRIDFAYPRLRIAVEVDGFETRVDRRVFQDDRWRQNDLVREGWRVVRFTWHDVVYRPEYVAIILSTVVLGEKMTG